jgi:hypothetical protein
MDYLSRRYDHLKSDIIRNERLLLREFGFIVHVEHPHKFVLKLHAGRRHWHEISNLISLYSSVRLRC